MEKPERSLKPYLEAKCALIVDSSKAFSSTMARVLSDLGMPLPSIIMASDGERARLAIERNSPDIIISEYQIGKDFGVNLIPLQHKYLPDARDRVFMIVTANANDSAVAEAIEEDIDSYMLKPFSPEQFKNCIEGVIKNKINPSKYIQTIEKGQKLLNIKDYENAKLIFLAAAKLSAKPSLALYYAGKTLTAQGKKSEALEFFAEGRKHNQLHFKCLQSEFEILFEMSRKEDAYERVKLLLENYPVSPQTLTKAFTLAIYTQNVKDIEIYYNKYLELEHRPSDLVKIVSAAMMAAGRLTLKSKGNVEVAMQYFRNGIVACNHDIDYIEKAVRALIQAKKTPQAEEVFKTYPGDRVGTPHHANLLFLITKMTLPPHRIVETGRKIIADGHATEEVFREVVMHLGKMKKITAAEAIIFQATQQFPAMKNELYLLIEQPRAS